MSLKKLLYVFAHPDDETFTSGITIAKYAAENVEISLLCATRGQAGKTGEPPLCTQKELPAVREQEMRDAAAILGIRHLTFLDYEDKYLAEVPTATLAAQIQAMITTHQPQVVVTFAPHGLSGHPDHRTISAVTDLAVKTLPTEQNPVRKLYHVTLPANAPFHNRAIHTDPPEAITTEITAPNYVETAGRALLAHRTQHLSVERVFPGISQGSFEHVRHTNYYMLVWHNLHEYLVTEKESDLFAGIFDES